MAVECFGGSPVCRCGEVDIVHYLDFIPGE